jgi:hypothetical protein
MVGAVVMAALISCGGTANYQVGYPSTNSSSNQLAASMAPGNIYFTGSTPHLCVSSASSIAVSVPLEFNKYVNGSDLLEEFITYLGEQGVKQKEVSELPVELFIKWLVIRACEEDGEDPEIEMPAIQKNQSRCKGCGKYMKNSEVLLHEECAVDFFRRNK